jgi:hypothetical protein
MPLTKHGAQFPYARQELIALFTCASQDEVEQGGRYEVRSAAVHVWSHPRRTSTLRDESSLVGSFYVNWQTERLTQIEWDEGFELADLLHELALLEEQAFGHVKHGKKSADWS